MKKGFGHGRFGYGPFGHSDWCYQVLYLDLPQRMIDQDQAEGALYEKFVKALCVPFNQMRKLIQNFGDLHDPLKIRLDLIRFYASGFGLSIDTEEAETFQRTEADMFSRFRLFKGQEESFIVLARMHGFEATVEELWWNGSGYTSTQPYVVDEVVGTLP